MLQTEFIRSMHCNYERVLLDKQPEDKKYQYCILSRGGIRGLLPCSLRYLNGLAYLYYDISSKQNLIQLYAKRCIKREWLKDFVWNLQQLQTELGRFLLDGRNILWYPEQVFQDLDSPVFSFLYVPYYEGENGFIKLLEYLVEHIDYEDDALVECVYKMYEQYERSGDAYLQGEIFEDVKCLELESEKDKGNVMPVNHEEKQEAILKNEDRFEMSQDELRVREEKSRKKGIRYFWDGKRRKDKIEREQYRRNTQAEMEGYAVAEEAVYEDYGQTIYIEEVGEPEVVVRRLYTPDGRIIMQLSEEICTIGKKKGEADLVLADYSVSRLHARISKEGDAMYLEDLNSTNGTYKNGLRLQPYEKRKLEEGDEIKIGKTELVYR